MALPRCVVRRQLVETGKFKTYADLKVCASRSSGVASAMIRAHEALKRTA